ncbi:MAG: hypothetical protein HY474_01570 [Candidatus Sungbacteria bacterium]|uniref:Glycine-zipper-containing OmpA-like membrane domain-containing protein n=1 Tax=Candidatus Sungiibacteriota bacterium TaxID=2750080 RepID=A0A933DT48_9BACT|nr:hypothetical protein [Candidatus Sungbacteria bacterium]
MMSRQWARLPVPPLLAIFLLTGCATYGPVGPTAPVFIGSGKTQAQFNQDDENCRRLATARAGDPAMVQEKQAATTVIGTLLGAAAGAALGGAVGGGKGAGIGAAAGGGAGLFGGLGAGTHQAQADASRIQQRWNVEFQSCMYAAGHLVPGAPAPAAQPAPAYVPPPPPPPPPTQPTGATAPPAAATSCKPSGKYVKTPQGFMPLCE